VIGGCSVWPLPVTAAALHSTMLCFLESQLFSGVCLHGPGRLRLLWNQSQSCDGWVSAAVAPATTFSFPQVSCRVRYRACAATTLPRTGGGRLLQLVRLTCRATLRSFYFLGAAETDRFLKPCSATVGTCSFPSFRSNGVLPENERLLDVTGFTGFWWQPTRNLTT
jgi:hypothetical protein